MPRPLRILVTRAAHQSSALADRLRELDADPIVIPTLQIVPPASFDALDAALDELATFDWLVLTSANAAEALIARLGSRELPDGLHIAAIGAASAAALQPLGRTADLIPPQAVAESLAESLLPHALGHRFLLIRAEQARDYIPDALRQAGAIVVIAPAYRTTIPAGAIDALRSLFSDPGHHLHQQFQRAAPLRPARRCRTHLAIRHSPRLHRPNHQPDTPRLRLPAARRSASSHRLQSRRSRYIR
jgi:uroporphyrinogen-III synthase